MGIFGALSAGRSGLVSNGAALSVIGNNIANVNTVGFKGSRTEFADLLSSQAGGGAAGRIGLGTKIAKVSTLFSQGNIESTGRDTDLAVEGNGFFVVRSSEGFLYTRAGNFTLDESGRLVTFQGLPVVGFKLNDDLIPASSPTDISVQDATSQASMTQSVSLKANLQADAPLLNGGAFDGTSFDTAFATSNFTASVRIFDSLGGAHDVTIFFTRTGTNAWAFNIGVDAAEVGDPPGTAGELTLVGTGTLTFNADGSLDTVTDNTANFTGGTQFTGAQDQTITIDFGTPNPGSAAPGTGLDGVTQFSAPSAMRSQSQDGFGSGQLLALTVDRAGRVAGVFDNGQTRSLFQLALAQFNNPEGLTPLGNSLYRESFESGAAAMGLPQTGGLGAVVSGALELANVELAQEFIDLISIQRSYQANARVITASDTLLNELINIVR